MLIGDALGVPYEFKRSHEIPESDLIDLTPPPDFHRSHASVEPGTWSDDGAQALCLLASLLDRGHLDLEDFGQRLVRWYDDGYMAVGNHVFDVGIATGKGIRAIRAGIAPDRSGGAEQSDNGNGSLMRVLPLALWHRGSDEDLVRDAQAQSLPTHRHLRSRVCCALYCLWARRVLTKAEDPWRDATQTLRIIYKDTPAALEELDWSIRPDDDSCGRGTGYVVDCLRSARHVQTESSYERVVRSAIRLGNDTDTTACVAGGIAGLRFGLHAIPERWRVALRGRELYEPLLTRLLALRAP